MVQVALAEVQISQADKLSEESSLQTAMEHDTVLELARAKRRTAVMNLEKALTIRSKAFKVQDLMAKAVTIETVRILLNFVVW